MHVPSDFLFALTPRRTIADAPQPLVINAANEAVVLRINDEVRIEEVMVLEWELEIRSYKLRIQCLAL